MHQNFTSNIQSIQQNLSKAELTLKFALRSYQNFHNQLAVRAKIGYDNNQQILALFVKITSVSFKPVELLLRFLEDSDLLSLAATCQGLYRFFYSPLGYRIIRSLRPVIVQVRREKQMPTFNRIYLQNLCSEVNLVGMDEDDRIAIIQTMRTNLMAARQKQKEIQKCNQEWDRRKIGLKQDIGRTIKKREEAERRIQLAREQVEKLNQLLQQSSQNIECLKDQQKKMLRERQSRRQELKAQQEKLARQKDLLIKKIKSQQKERQQGLIYARQVARVTALLSRLTKK